MSGHYQSKVFNFLLRQSLRLQTQTAQTWRHLKVATVWGVQILLYPIYLGFQTTRLIGRQLQQAARQTVPRLRAATQAIGSSGSLAADTPIRKTLAALTSVQVSLPGSQDILLLPAESESNLERELALYARQHPDQPTTIQMKPVSSAAVAIDASAASVPDVSAVRIQGIASRLETGSLVLVTTRNQILDILTSDQQAELTRRMVWELASYWRRRRLTTPSQQPLLSNYLPLAKVQPNALPPIRLLQAIMAWMQRGSVAVALNLFQESRLGYETGGLLLPSSPVDAGMKSAQPGWVAVEAQFYDWLERAGETASALLIAGLSAGLDAFKQTSFQRNGGQLQPAEFTPTPLGQPTDSISALPKDLANDWFALIDHWLSQLPGLREQPPALPPQTTAHPWLTMDDLFELPNAAQGTRTGTLPTPTSNAAASDPITNNNRNWLKHSLRRILPQNSALRPVDQTNWELTDTAALEKAIKSRLANLRQSKSSNDSNDLAVVQSSSTNLPAPSAAEEWDADLHQAPASAWARHPLQPPLSSLDTANEEEAAMMPPSWIEAEAEVVGYVKHPLERLLEWIDKGMAWIEKWIARIWRWVTRKS
ncbi:MAG: hypothetical protein IGS54_21380 [Elainella sp. C42_A2020_010]|nr:hypothetical protein [Elainella sp. C42_A2020_010]